MTQALNQRSNPQNRKYITYRNGARGGPNQGDSLPLANMHSKFCKVWPCGFRVMRVDRQTDRHVHHNTSYPCRGEV